MKALGNPQQLFSSFLRGASRPKSPRSINVKDIVAQKVRQLSSNISSKSNAIKFYLTRLKRQTRVDRSLIAFSTL